MTKINVAKTKDMAIDFRRTQLSITNTTIHNKDSDFVPVYNTWAL